MKFARAVLCLSLALTGAACTDTAPRVTPSTAQHAAPTQAAGGCLEIRREEAPAWAATSGPQGLPFVAGQDDDVIGYVFADPLRAGHPTDPAKPLWVVRLPREGQALEMTAHPMGETRPVMRYSEPADSGPGEIYPSIIDVPTAGCWHLALAWAGHRDELDLQYAPPTTT
jgi:hypothetical protein